MVSNRAKHHKQYQPYQQRTSVRIILIFQLLWSSSFSMNICKTTFRWRLNFFPWFFILFDLFQNLSLRLIKYFKHYYKHTYYTFNPEIVGNKAKGRISKRVFQESKARQNFRKTNISYPLIRTRTYQGVRNLRAQTSIFTLNKFNVLFADFVQLSEIFFWSLQKQTC